MTSVYSAVVTVDGGRDGRARSDDGRLDLELSLPPALGGAGGAGTNPEQLFAAGYAACFQTALLGTAKRAGIEVTGSSITSTVELIRGSDDPGFVLGVQLAVTLPGVGREEAERLVETVHTSVCPHSKAIRNNVEVTINVI